MKNVSSLNIKSFSLMLLVVLSNSYNLLGQSNEHTTRINNQLNRIETSARQAGARRIYSHTIRSLKPNTNQSYTLDLQTSMVYNIAGVCDVDCSDIDIIVYDSNGKIISRDVKSNDTPSIFFSPKQSGKYSLQVKMIKCSTSLCYYGFAIFGKSKTDIARENTQRLRRQIVTRLDKQKETSETSGLRKTHNYIIGVLGKTPKKYSTTVELKRGMIYTFAGVCDEDCTDLDINIYYRNRQIASDDTTDDLPAIIVKPKRTGNYRVEIIMYKCGKPPCWYGVGVFGK